jgi:uncharacterized membrane protein
VTNVVLFLHIAGALLFVGGIVVAGIAFEAGRRRERPDEIALLLGLTRAGVSLVGIGALLLFVCGLWLAGLEDDVGYGAAWVDAALVLFLVAVALGAFGGQRPKKARELAEQLAKEGRPTATHELRALLDDPLSRIANYASAALIFAILALMVFKP